MIVLGLYTSLIWVYFFAPISLAFAYFMGSMCWSSIQHEMDQYYFKNHSVATSARVVKKELIDNSYLQTTAHGSDRLLKEPIYVEEFDYLVEYEFRPKTGGRQTGCELISEKYFENLAEGMEIPIYYLNFDPSISRFRGRKFMNQLKKQQGAS